MISLQSKLRMLIRFIEGLVPSLTIASFIQSSLWGLGREDLIRRLFWFARC